MATSNGSTAIRDKILASLARYRALRIGKFPCAFWRLSSRPGLTAIVTLGSFPLKEYLRLSDQRTSKIKLDQYVEKSEAWDEKLIIFFPHTSGGARWLNITSNKKLFIKAQTLLRTALIAIPSPKIIKHFHESYQVLRPEKPDYLLKTPLHLS